MACFSFPFFFLSLHFLLSKVTPFFLKLISDQCDSMPDCASTKYSRKCNNCLTATDYRAQVQNWNGALGEQASSSIPVVTVGHLQKDGYLLI